MPEYAGEEKERKTGGIRRSLFLKILPYIFFAVLGVFGGIYIAQQKPDWFGLAKGAAASQAEVDALVAQVGKLINLPTDEKPTVATVTDASKIKDQVFFKDAANGDKVLIYQKAQKAILFRPSENRIIEVGAVNINNQPQVSPTPTSTPMPKETKASSTPTSTPTSTAAPKN